MRWFTTFSLVGLFAVLAMALEPGNSPPAPKPSGSNADLLQFIAAREKTMTRVTDKPHSMDWVLMDRCIRGPLPTELPENNPHLQHSVHVYVSPSGADTLRTGQGTYAVGTLIVKEKLPGIHFNQGVLVNPEQESADKSKSPELFTAMLKREPGYHKECGDWEFLVISGDAKQVQARGKIDSCVQCHLDYKATDYVTRVYLPAK